MAETGVPPDTLVRRVPPRRNGRRRPARRFAIRLAAPRVRISSRHPGASPSARLCLPGPRLPPRGSQDRLTDQIYDVLSVLNSYSRKE
jgi:hypothetical protein